MEPNKITIHCSATREGQYHDVETIREMHLARGFTDVGYHYIIRLDALVDSGRDLTIQGAHVKGHNEDNIGICIVGGLNSRGKSEFTFSREQMKTCFALIVQLCERYDISFDDLYGHRDFSPDINGDGVITPDEYLKECPCFDVRTWVDNCLIGLEVSNGLV